MHELLFALWFFWPAGVATMIPVLVTKLPGLKSLNWPIDGGRNWRGHRLLGDNKTWRGLVTGTIAGTIWCEAQIIIYDHSDFVRSFTHVDYSRPSILLLGFFLSLGAMVGDAGGSLCKRQLNIAPGKAWFPYDQLDFIAGGLLFSLLAVRLPAVDYLIISAVWVGVHLLFGVLGYLFHFKKKLI